MGALGFRVILIRGAEDIGVVGTEGGALGGGVEAGEVNRGPRLILITGPEPDIACASGPGDSGTRATVLSAGSGRT